MTGAANETIYALATGAPPAALAIVRISGDGADRALASMTKLVPAARYAALTKLRDASGLLLDEAIVIRFPQPRSATGEAVVELHLHGGRAVVAAVLAHLDMLEGVRLARPGEFTRRALANGRISVQEAEGLADLLAAETEWERRAALLRSSGALGREWQTWTARLRSVSAMLEAEIDFADEEDVDTSETWRDAAAELLTDLRVRAAAPSVERLRDGVRVVIAGAPNQGKSTLLNRIVGRSAAIVTDRPGTTRDLLEIPVAIDGIPFLFADTAGLRESDDQVEQIGIERARAAARSADILLWLDPDLPALGGPQVIHVRPKSDLVSEGEPDGRLFVSALTGENIDLLLKILVEHAGSALSMSVLAPLSHGQQRALEESATLLMGACGANDPAIAAEHLRMALGKLDERSFIDGSEAVLDALFSRFCLGK